MANTRARTKFRLDKSFRLDKGIRLDKERGWIFGVCAGLANCLHTDPALVRVGVAISGLFFPKLVIAIYLVAWLALNERSQSKSRA
jgi:phage shock protein PspC (stress-responsive transcriptional regulator)